MQFTFELSDEDVDRLARRVLLRIDEMLGEERRMTVEMLHDQRREASLLRSGITPIQRERTPAVAPDAPEHD